MTYVDFLTSAAVTGPIVARAQELGLGATVLAAVQATREEVGVNTNLGTLLLVVPLTLGHLGRYPEEKLGIAARRVVRAATPTDAEQVYEAIRLARPGGLGKVAAGDVEEAPSISLFEAMELAAERDLVARQWINGFNEVAEAAEVIQQEYHAGTPLGEAIVVSQLTLLAAHGDSLVARKLGNAASRDVATRAALVLSKRGDAAEYLPLRHDFDFWLRSDGNRRNPGTTADLLAASLLMLQLEGRLTMPVRFY
jgi:triphosphoribosyl-dephospho-CoA synthase